MSKKVGMKMKQMLKPKRRKESNLPISETAFHKHVYGKQPKHEINSLEDFDPRPPEEKGKVKEHLNLFLQKVRGQGLGVSVLFDEKY